MRNLVGIDVSKARLDVAVEVGAVQRFANDDPGITTAGHCDPDQDRGPTQLRFKQGRFGRSVDAQWYTAEDDDYTPDNTVWDGTGHRHVSSTRSRSQQSIGTLVCHYGKTSGHGCGSITSKTYRPQWGGVYFSSTWILVANANVNLAEGATAVARGS